MEYLTADKTAEEIENIEKKYIIPRAMERAQADGTIVLGATIGYYMHRAIKTNGWMNMVIWGTQGTGKSNLALSLGYLIYRDWDVVLKHVVMNLYELNALLREKGPGRRIPLIIFDDMNAYLPRTLYFSEREAYMRLKSAWDLMRLNFSIFISTVVLKTDMAQFILRNITDEIKTTERRVWRYHRWMTEMDFDNREKIITQSIFISAHKLQLEWDPNVSPELVERGLPGGVPRDVFRQYWERRQALADRAMARWSDVADAIERALEKEEKGEEDKAMERGRGRGKRRRIPADVFDPEGEEGEGRYEGGEEP